MGLSTALRLHLRRKSRTCRLKNGTSPCHCMRMVGLVKGTFLLIVNLSAKLYSAALTVRRVRADP